MRKYITSYEEYTPICIPEGSKIEFIDTDIYDYIRNSTETQFKYEAIIKDTFSQLYGNGRLRDFILGRGLIFEGSCLRVILCRDGKVITNKEWYLWNPTEFKRLKKSLTQNGYKTRNDECFVFIDNLNSKFFLNPLSPNMEDYEESKQLELSSEFLTQERAKLSSLGSNMEDLGELILEHVNEEIEF